jgi:hypothetical protein
MLSQGDSSSLGVAAIALQFWCSPFSCIEQQLSAMLANDTEQATPATIKKPELTHRALQIGPLSTGNAVEIIPNTPPT